MGTHAIDGGESSVEDNKEASFMSTDYNRLQSKWWSGNQEKDTITSANIMRKFYYMTKQQ